ncbi:terpene synthase family protein [Streptomyces sp. NPDC003006]
MTTLPDLPSTLPLPDLQFPVPSMVHPDADRIEGYLTRWATDLHLLSDEDAAQRLARAQLGGFAAYCHPRAADLELAAEWNALMWFIDDVIDEQQGSDEVMLDLAHDLLAQMPADLHAPRPTQPLTRAMADLWSRMAPAQSLHWRAQAVGHYRTALACALQTRDHRARPREGAADLAAYIRRRRQHSGTQMSLDLIELGHEVSPVIADSDLNLDIRLLAANITGWTNDLWSLPKDHHNTDPVNLVIVLFFARGGTWEQALATATAMTEDAIRDFFAACDDLRRARPLYGVGDSEWEYLEGYLTGIAEWLAGMVRWHAETGRYREIPQIPWDRSATPPPAALIR